MRMATDIPTLIVITGPTASGKSALAVEVARRLDTDVISADSRQVYRGIPIVTAVPTEEERKGVRHHLLEMLPLDAYYSASRFEEDALSILGDLFERRGVGVVCGGSMMYVDAVTRGIDLLPTISEDVRRTAYNIYEQGGIDAVREKLQEFDPDYYAIVDKCNHKRMIHAIEITLQAGQPYSSLRTGAVKPRPFKILKYAIEMPREILFERINRRVDLMIEAGLEEEVLDTATGQQRNSRSQSGGESFLVSLSLALGLSDVVQNHAGGQRLDALFIDEGFGSLDGNTLDTALNVLNQLTEGNCMVGIISHVSRLEESIPQKIRVKNSERGSSLRYE